jgi:hypothetical protein
MPAASHCWKIDSDADRCFAPDKVSEHWCGRCQELGVTDNNTLHLAIDSGSKTKFPRAPVRSGISFGNWLLVESLNKLMFKPTKNCQLLDRNNIDISRPDKSDLTRKL